MREIELLRECRDLLEEVDRLISQIGSFEIDKTDLQFNVRTFYQAFFADDLDYSDIELQNMLTSDKNATRIFKCVEQLMKEVVEKLNKEMSVEDNHEK